ncbi:hypothetical protein DLAC_09511 [Tieghemostelium lacteum]|uniref:Uncharacterized protein n=1 Tax=Tieghemostelium lacteum TaxID=361077 RepID=A0A151Z6I2_TIELA|nr:hypothetical protein DLAC_09511 [Tieghemostelium lacteum]|eukprot:KYQ89562.1 hypothetical protein DLAC_09511 [Tieghemostelium lacteum]
MDELQAIYNSDLDCFKCFWRNLKEFVQPVESIWQMELYCSFSNLLGNTVIPNAGGMIDFYVERPYNWGIELLSEGIGTDEHLNRFKTIKTISTSRFDNNATNMGIYVPLMDTMIKEWIVIDFSSEMLYQNNAPKVVDPNLCIITYSTDFKTYNIYYQGGEIFIGYSFSNKFRKFKQQQPTRDNQDTAYNVFSKLTSNNINTVDNVNEIVKDEIDDVQQQKVQKPKSPFINKQQNQQHNNSDSFAWNAYEQQQINLKKREQEQHKGNNAFQEFKQKLNSPIKDNNNNTIVSKKPVISHNTPTKAKLSFPVSSSPVPTVVFVKSKKRQLEDDIVDNDDSIPHSYNSSSNFTPTQDLHQQNDNIKNNNSNIGSRLDKTAFINNQKGVGSVYPFLRNKSNLFKQDQKYLGSLLKQPTQTTLLSRMNSDDQPLTQLVNDQQQQQQPPQQLQSQRSTLSQHYYSTSSSAQPTNPLPIQPIQNIIRSSSNLSINNILQQQINYEEIEDEEVQAHESHVVIQPTKKDEIKEEKKVVIVKQSTIESIEDDNDDEHITFTHQKQQDPVQVDLSPPPPTFKDVSRRSPNSSKYRYVREEIDDEQQTDEPIWKSRNILKDDDINMNDDDDDNDIDGDNIPPINFQQDNNSNRPLKSKWLDNLSDSIINSNSHNSSSNTVTSSVTKLLKQGRKKITVRGGLSERLAKLLNKEKFNYDLYQRRNAISSQCQSLVTPIANHYTVELMVKIVQTPSLIQPHVYVCQCICSNWPNQLPNPTLTGTQLVTVLFSMSTKTELKLELYSCLLIEYWHLVSATNQKQVIIYSHITKPLPSQNQPDILKDNSIESVHQYNQSEKIEISTVQLYNQQHQQSNNNNNSKSTEDILEIISKMETTQLEDLNQNLIDINLNAIILQCFIKHNADSNSNSNISGLKSIKEKTKNMVNNQNDDGIIMSIYVANFQGFVAEIQIPNQYSHRWKDIAGGDVFCECLFQDLQFIRNTNQLSIGFCSFLNHYIPIDFQQQQQFNLTVLRVKENSSFYLCPTPNPSFTMYYQPIPVQSVQKTLELLLNNSYSLVNRVSIVGVVVYIQPLSSNSKSFFIFVLDVNSNNNNLNTIGVEFRDKQYYKQIFIGDHWTLQHLVIQPPQIPSSTILLVDEFSMVSKNQQQQQQQQQMQIYQPSVGAEVKLSIGILKDQLPIHSFLNPLNDNIYKNYQFISRFRAKVTHVETNDCIYRGCSQCSSPVSKFQNDYIPLAANGDATFCRKCRKLVSSDLMIELQLICSYQEKFIKLKIGNIYCQELFIFPLEYSLVNEYTDIISNLNGKNVEFNGLAQYSNDSQSEIHVDIISDPIFDELV